MTIFRILLACLFLAAAQSVPPDEIHSRSVPYTPPSQVTLRADVQVVEVPVVVRDAEHRAVAGLSKDDFEIQDNGKKQVITAFSVQSATEKHADHANQRPPRFLALCFDDLHLLPAALEPVKTAAQRFVKSNVSLGDRVVALRTSRSESAKFSDDGPALVESIANITSAPQPALGDSQLSIQPYEAYLIANHLDPGDQLHHQKMAECSRLSDPRNPCYESMITGPANMIWTRARSSSENTLGMLDSLVDAMAKLPGQRIILLTSSGFLTGTLDGQLDRLMDKARHANVIINALDARGTRLRGADGMAYDGMGVLATGTGGAFYHNRSDLDQGFRELGVIPETIYMLSFDSKGAPDGRFHRLKVQLKSGKGYSLSARQGYIASAPQVSKLDSEAASAGTISDLPVSFSWQQWEGPSGITMIAKLDIGRLHFEPYQDRRTQRLTIIGVLLDGQGNFVAGKKSTLELSFKDATYQQLAKSGFTVAMTLPAPPGTYSVRAVAQDALENKLSAASASIQIK